MEKIVFEFPDDDSNPDIRDWFVGWITDGGGMEEPCNHLNIDIDDSNLIDGGDTVVIRAAKEEDEE